MEVITRTRETRQSIFAFGQASRVGSNLFAGKSDFLDNLIEVQLLKLINDFKMEKTKMLLKDAGFLSDTAKWWMHIGEFNIVLRKNICNQSSQSNL